MLVNNPRIITSELLGLNAMEVDEVFEAISHPIRVEILKKLSEKPMSFSELKRALGITSSGKLDFHLKKLDGLVTLNEEGLYCLTSEGYSALQAVNVIERYGWQRRALFLNLAAYAFSNAFAALVNSHMWLRLVLPLSTAWIVFYVYWSIKKRRLLIRR